LNDAAGRRRDAGNGDRLRTPELEAWRTGSYTEVEMNWVGEHLHQLRVERNLTLKDLASRCKLSASFLSQLERGLSSVSIVSLDSICQALGTSLASFFSRGKGSEARAVDAERSEAEVLRVAEQPIIRMSDSTIKYRFLGRDFPGSTFEILLGEISPGFSFPPKAHDGEEFGYVLQGKLQLTLGGEVYELGPGDSYHVDATTPHGYAAESSEPVRILWVQTLKYLKTRDGLPVHRDSEKGSLGR